MPSGRVVFERAALSLQECYDEGVGDVELGDEACGDGVVYYIEYCYIVYFIAYLSIIHSLSPHHPFQTEIKRIKGKRR